MNSEIEQAGKNNTSLGAPSPNEVPFLERIVTKLEKGIEKLNSVTHRVSQVILFSLMFLTTADVFGRYFFNSPVRGTYEITGLGLAMIIFFSLGMTQIKKDHIAIDFLTNKLPQKAQEALNALTGIVVLILLALTTWQLIEYTKRVYAGGELSGDVGLPLYIFTILATVGILFFTLSILADIARSMLKVVQKNE